MILKMEKKRGISGLFEPAVSDASYKMKNCASKSFAKNKFSTDTYLEELKLVYTEVYESKKELNQTQKRLWKFRTIKTLRQPSNATFFELICSSRF